MYKYHGTPLPLHNILYSYVDRVDILIGIYLPANYRLQRGSDTGHTSVYTVGRSQVIGGLSDREDRRTPCHLVTKQILNLKIVYNFQLCIQEVLMGVIVLVNIDCEIIIMNLKLDNSSLFLSSLFVCTFSLARHLFLYLTTTWKSEDG